MLPFLWFLFLSFPISTHSKNLNLFILAGQSNMAGRGGVTNNTAGLSTWDHVVPCSCKPNPKIFRLNANLTWVHAHEPLHADIDVTKINGIGPGMAFANTVLKNDVNFGLIGLVPCAIGGTNISEWQKGGKLYEHMLKRVNAAVRSGGEIEAVLWYQGESDAINKEDAELYKGRLDKFFMDLRSDLKNPLLNIIQVALASGGPYMDIVRKAQMEIELLNLKTVDAKGLPLEPDTLHLTSASQVQLGHTLADAFLQSLPRHLSMSNATTTSDAAPSVSKFDFGYYLIVVLVLINSLTLV